MIKLETTLAELHQLDQKLESKRALLSVSSDLLRRLMRDHRKLAAEVPHEDPQ